MKKGNKEEELLFVRITDPSSVRRKILESSREIIECLQKYENLKAVRKEKLENIMKLKEDTKKVVSLISTLKSKMPKTHLKAKEEKKPVEVPKKEVVETQKPKTELDKLQSELNDIESKLNALS